jgi:hypothetical protein
MYIVVESKNENEEEMNIFNDVKKYVILFDEINGNNNIIILLMNIILILLI